MNVRQCLWIWPATALIGVLLGGCASAAPIPPTVPALSPAQIEAQAALDLENSRETWLGSYPDIEVPEVERERFIDWQEWPEVMAACLTDAGFPTEVVAGGGIPTTPPVGQERAFSLAAYVCRATYPVNPRQTKKLDEDQLEYLYEYHKQFSIPCMRENGFGDSPAPPTLQTFIDAYGTDEAWTPFETASTEATSESWEKIEANCPQTPDELFG